MRGRAVLSPEGGEGEILEAIRSRVHLPRGSGLALGMGDDCAIYRPRGAPEDLLFTTDLLIEDVHFHHATHPPDALGHKALARGLSDIAAMGGVPRFCLLSLAVGKRVDRLWIDRFFAGLLRLAEPDRYTTCRRRPGARRQGNLRYRGLRRGAARTRAAAGRRSGGRCHLCFRAAGWFGVGARL